MQCNDSNILLDEDFLYFQEKKGSFRILISFEGAWKQTEEKLEWWKEKTKLLFVVCFSVWKMIKKNTVK